MYIKVIDNDVFGGQPYINWLYCDSNDYDLVEQVVTDACNLVFGFDNMDNEHYGLGFGEVEDLVKNELMKSNIKCYWFDSDLEIYI